MSALRCYYYADAKVEKRRGSIEQLQLLGGGERARMRGGGRDHGSGMLN